MKKKKIKTIEDLGMLVQQEFLTVNERFSAVDKNLEKLRNEILELKSDVEDIKLRMGEVAFRFEIQDVERRLKKLEMKVGLR
jgi:predicted  nucleic acid-binding Zn-ribbon protein